MFRRSCGKSCKTAKQDDPEVRLTLLLSYHQEERPIPVSAGFDTTYYPLGMKDVPRKIAFVRVNRYIVAHTDFLTTYT